MVAFISWRWAHWNNGVNIQNINILYVQKWWWHQQNGTHIIITSSTSRLMFYCVYLLLYMVGWVCVCVCKCEWSSNICEVRCVKRVAFACRGDCVSRLCWSARHVSSERSQRKAKTLQQQQPRDTADTHETTTGQLYSVTDKQRTQSRSHFVCGEFSLFASAGRLVGGWSWFWFRSFTVNNITQQSRWLCVKRPVVHTLVYSSRSPWELNSCSAVPSLVRLSFSGSRCCMSAVLCISLYKAII